MALGKMLNLGGIDNRPPKANQTMGRFRVARNVYPTPDGRIIPRYDYATPVSQPSRVKAYHHITQYDTSALSVLSRDVANTGATTEFLQWYLNTSLIPQAGLIDASPFDTLANDTNNSISSYRKNNTTYFQNPYTGCLSKYDGVQIWPAGCPQPIISSTGIDVAGPRYVKAIQHTTDFDNNDVWSESVEYPILAATGSVDVRVDGGATNMIILPGGEEISPNNVISETSLPRLYFVGTASYNAGTQDYSITTTDTNITSNMFVGAYVVCGINQTLTPAVFNGGDTALAFAMKVKSVSPLVLDALNIRYLDNNREWQIEAGPSITVGASIAYGTQTFLSFWVAASRTGIYYYKNFTPSFPYSLTSYTVTVTTTPDTSAAIKSDENIIVMGPQLNKIYDVNTRKLSPNSAYPFGLNQGFYCMTNFQDLMLLASDDLIWFSDPTLGGSYEQLNTSSFIRVGDTEYGRITSICGTQDFLMVSRERKNYYVTGNITTGNYRVQEVIEAEIGAWSNVASINIKDSVIFLTALGVYQIVAGGKATNLSATCPKNFATYDAMSINEDVSFRMTGFVSDISNITVDGLSVAYDEYRELLVFMKKGVVNNPCFVLHAKTGECYEWDGMVTGITNTYANCIAFIQAEYYLGQIDTSATGYSAEYNVEDSSVALNYPIANPVKLYTSWLTAGEPSLEKSLLQLKLFGRVQSNASVSSIKVCHYRDWDINTKITNVTYYPQNRALSLNNQVQYSHKQRLNSDKVLAASVGIEMNTASVTFEIESFEVEFNSIQVGMKK